MGKTVPAKVLKFALTLLPGSNPFRVTGFLLPSLPENKMGKTDENNRDEMRLKFVLSILLILLLTGCNRQHVVDQVYRYYCGETQECHIWIVDGATIREKVYDSFLYGGNEQRYLFNPKGEIWIDHAISCEEFELTLAHELNERHLMARFGWTYYQAHDSSLQLEIRMRKDYETVCRNHEASLPEVSPTDYSGVKEIRDIPDSVRLVNIYRVPLGTRDGIGIWVVDGYLVRKMIYPDFGFSANDRSCHFIPTGEIWIDGQISCEETEYCIATEMTIRKLMIQGKPYSDAYSAAITENDARRNAMESLVRSHSLLVVPEVLARDTGVIDPNEK
jgi:hypothetical protein